MVGSVEKTTVRDFHQVFVWEYPIMIRMRNHGMIATQEANTCFLIGLVLVGKSTQIGEGIVLSFEKYASNEKIKTAMRLCNAAKNIAQQVKKGQSNHYVLISIPQLLNLDWMESKKRCSQ